MHSSDPKAVATNAAGIADAFRLCQIQDPDGEARVIELSERFDGWIGVVEQIVAAATRMERHRTLHGPNAAWGAELPYIYEVWDAVAKLLWNELPVENIAGLVARAVESAKCVHD